MGGRRPRADAPIRPAPGGHRMGRAAGTPRPVRRMSYRFRCPKCGNKVEALIKPIGAPTCDGRHADHDGKVLAGHLACKMDEDSSASLPKTPKGHPTMKNPDNVCQCFSEHVD